MWWVSGEECVFWQEVEECLACPVICCVSRSDAWSAAILSTRELGWLPLSVRAGCLLDFVSFILELSKIRCLNSKVINKSVVFKRF